MGIFSAFLGRLSKTKTSLTRKDVKKGSNKYIADGVCSMGMSTLQGGVFLSAFAIAIGASNYEIGLISTITFISQLMQLPGLYLVRKHKKRRAITVLSASVSRSLWIFIILIPIIFDTRGMTFLLQWYMVATLAGAMAMPAWNSLIRDVIPPRTMGRTNSRRMMIGTALALSLNLGGGYFVDWWKVEYSDIPLYSYSILFSVGMFLGLISLAVVSRMPEPAMDPTDNTSIFKLLSRPIKDSNFRGLLVYIMTWTFTVNMAVPFFIIYMLKRIGLSVFLVTVLTVVSQVTNILFLRIWGKLADRFSNKSVLAASGTFFLMVILAWTFTTMPERYFFTIPLLFLIHFFNGMSTSGVTLSSANIALKLSPQGQAHAYMTVFGLAGALAGAISPVIGGAIADFFAARELSLSLNWSEPSRQFAFYAFNFKTLDFLFFAAFLIGLFAINRLGKVKEEGEVKEEEIMDRLKDELTEPLRRIADMPFSAVSKIKNGITGKTREMEAVQRPPLKKRNGNRPKKHQ